jgi:hypothetical protein
MSGEFRQRVACVVRRRGSASMLANADASSDIAWPRSLVDLEQAEELS